LYFRWINVLERVVKLELPPEDSDVTEDTSASLSSSSNPSQPNPADIGLATSAPVSLPETEDGYENIYETLD